MLKLEIEYDYDFILFGISCHEPTYRLCWAINKEFGLNLEKQEKDICIFNKEIESFHQHFYFESKEDEVYYSLVRNRGEEGGLLMPDYPNMDYFLKIENYSQDENEYMEQLRKLPWVNAVFKIQAEGSKFKENLIFD